MKWIVSAVPLFECMIDPATMDWLVGLGVKLPETVPPGRYPTPDEMRQVLETLPGIRVDFTISASTWQATVRARRDVSWASLYFPDYAGDDFEPQPFIFDGGWPEIMVMILQPLAAGCGPFILLDESGAPPRIVM